MDQLDALALAGQCLVGVLGFMALIGLALLLVNWVGRRRGEKTNAPASQNAGDTGETAGHKTIEQSTKKDKGE